MGLSKQWVEGCNNWRKLKAIYEICGKSAWLGTFSMLTALRVNFSKKTKKLFIDIVQGSVCTKFQVCFVFLGRLLNSRGFWYSMSTFSGRENVRIIETSCLRSIVFKFISENPWFFLMWLIFHCRQLKPLIWLNSFFGKSFIRLFFWKKALMCLLGHLLSKKLV